MRCPPNWEITPADWGVFPREYGIRRPIGGTARLGNWMLLFPQTNKKLTELRAQLDKTGDQWHKKRSAPLLSERKPIQNQIKELESENNRLQDERRRYIKAFGEAGLISNPEAMLPKPTLGDNLNALRLDAAAGISSFSNSVWKALDWLIPDEMINNGENFMRDTFDTAYASHNDWLEKKMPQTRRRARR